jgi:hypothetical protein
MTFSWNGDRISFRSLSLAWNLENMSSTPNHTRDDGHDVSQNLPMGSEQMTRLAVFGDFGPNFAALCSPFAYGIEASVLATNDVLAKTGMVLRLHSS